MKLIRIALAVNRNYGYYRDVLRGIVRYAETKPEWHFISIAPEQSSLQGLRKLKAAGLIASVQTSKMAQDLAGLRRPMVNVSIVLPGMRFPRVGVDNAIVGQQAAAHFLERGLVNFGFIGPAEHQYSIERGEQFRLALLEAGYKVSFYHTPAEVPFDPHCQFWDLGLGVYRWLRALPKPVGVFVPADDWGVQVSEACRQAGMRIPEDVALIGVDNDDLDCQLSRPRQSSVIVPSERIGYEAAALLDLLLAGNPPPAEPILLPSLGVVSRRSTDFLAIEDQDVASAMRFIREHAHEPLQVDDVVCVIPLSRRMLEIRFQKSIGWGISKEIRRAHLELARRLLIRTKLPISTVAIKAGFSDTRQLDVVFRKELGQSPTEYRRHMCGDGNLDEQH